MLSALAVSSLGLAPLDAFKRPIRWRRCHRLSAVVKVRSLRPCSVPVASTLPVRRCSSFTDRLAVPENGALFSVNVLIFAHRSDYDDHEAYAAWLRELAEGDARFGCSE